MTKSLRLSLWFAAALLAVGCRPGVGDSCVSDAECERPQVCDTTSPGGYCTVFDCEDERCPGDALCVGFERDGVLVTTACMEQCDKDSQCRERDGYVCQPVGTSQGYCGVEGDVVVRIVSQ
ncbi:MAG: hypothetical protein H6700_02495 [Myxococcales bacterium]|nr:hypothetical protein [Myxococcales bacterium]